MATKLKAAREAAGLTQMQASERSGIPLGTLRRWEQGVNEPDIESIILLADLYDTTTDVLLGSKFAVPLKKGNKAMTIAENIRRVRTQHSLTQEEFGEIAGVSSMAVSQWENGRAVPRMGAVQRIADHFGIPKGDVIDEKMDDRPAHASALLPLYGSIAAGTPIEMIELDDFHEVPASVAEDHPNAFLLKVSGESMNRILPNGCYALIDPCETVERPGQPYAVCVNGFDATIKRVRPLENGFELIPDSTDPTYRPQVYDYGVEGTDEITIIGRVVWFCVPSRWEF